MSEKKMLRNVFVDGDKYFNSGDLMYMDNDYFVYFQDRLGDTFRYNMHIYEKYEPEISLITRLRQHPHIFLKLLMKTLS